MSTSALSRRPFLQRIPSGMKFVNLLLGGWTAVVMAFLYLPILLLVVYSFNDSKLNIEWKGFTFKWYVVLWQDRLLIAALKNSLVIAAITTMLSVVFGTLAAWLLYRYRFPFRRLITTLAFLPMIVPEIIMGISLLVFFALVFKAMKLVLPAGVEPQLGYTTIIISHVTFCFPFVMVAVQARLVGLDPSLEEAAMDLGATPMQAFRLIMVPYLMPAIVAGALMSFTLSLDELIVTYFTYSARSETLPIRMFGMVKKGLNPSLNAISTILIVGTVGLMMAAELLKKTNR